MLAWSWLDSWTRLSTSLADTVEIPVLKTRSRAQPCLCEGLEAACSEGWRNITDCQAVGIQPYGAGAARDACSMQPVGEGPAVCPGYEVGQWKTQLVPSWSIASPLWVQETGPGWGCCSSQGLGEKLSCVEGRKIQQQNEPVLKISGD